jgi:hypothetical protein
MAQINWIETYPDEHSRMMVKDAYDVAVSLELLDEIKNINPERGFMFTENPVIDKISKNLKYQGHSGCSFGWTMRQLEYLIKNM